MANAGTGTSDQRAFPRWMIGETGSLRTSTDTHECRVVDISASGIRLETAASLSVTDTAEVMLSRMVPLRIRIVRTEPGVIAATFARGPLYLFR